MAICWKCCDRVLEINERPLIMGIINVTPDSFSDGGSYFDPEKAVEHGLEMIEEGADIIDIGGESTRPGAKAVSNKDEIERVVPVIKELRKQTDVVLSIDTTKAEVARSAIEAGAQIINDVSALTHEAEMEEVAKESGAGIVLMHMKGSPRTMQNDPQYDDVVKEVYEYLRSRVDALIAKGLDSKSLVIDPGIGFGKTVEHNMELIVGLDKFVGMGFPVMVGLSRKSFLGKLTDREVNDRLAGSLAALSICVYNGVQIMRVHDVSQSVDAAEIASVLKKERA